MISSQRPWPLDHEAGQNGRKQNYQKGIIYEYGNKKTEVDQEIDGKRGWTNSWRRSVAGKSI